MYCAKEKGALGSEKVKYSETMFEWYYDIDYFCWENGSQQRE